MPSISHQARWPYEVLGVAFIAFGMRRQREIRDAIARDTFEHPDDRFLALFTAIGIGLGAMLLVLVVIQT